MREIIHWDIHILGANKREASNEITVNFRAENLDNDEVFFTDG
jgi:hypothetical protein